MHILCIYHKWHWEVPWTLETGSIFTNRGLPWERSAVLARTSFPILQIHQVFFGQFPLGSIMSSICQILAAKQRDHLNLELIPSITHMGLVDTQRNSSHNLINPTHI